MVDNARQATGGQGASSQRPSGSASTPAAQPKGVTSGAAKGTAPANAGGGKEGGTPQGQKAPKGNPSQGGPMRGRSEDMCEVWPD